MNSTICLYGDVVDNDDNAAKKAMPEPGVEQGLERAMNPEEWVDQYGDRLFKFAVARVRDEALAEDLVQDTFVSAVRAYGNFEGRSAVRTWLLSILKNKIIDHFRKQSRQGDKIPFEGEETLPTAGMSKVGVWNTFVHNWAGDPDAVVEGQEFLSALQACFDKLPERYQRIFQVKLTENLSTEEVCKLFDITSSNYWVLLHRIRMQLRQCLDKNWYST